MADEGFHEIQLGKKQLFFLFMAAALFSVVVFSLGVWVGQDVRRPDSEITAEIAPDTPADSTPAPTKVAPNELDYAARLQSDGKAKPEAKPVEPPSPPDTEVATAPKAAPKSGGVILQVGAFSDATTAQNLATRLKAKGYAAYMFDAETGPSRYRVRVGPLGDNAEADKVMARLKKEEGFSPFITR